MEEKTQENSKSGEAHLLPLEDVEIKSVKTLSKFSKIIESVVIEHGLSYMDAVLHYCEKTGLEYETAGSLIKSSPVLKAKIQLEAEKANFLTKTARLPVEE